MDTHTHKKRELCGTGGGREGTQQNNKKRENEARRKYIHIKPFLKGIRKRGTERYCKKYIRT